MKTRDETAEHKASLDNRAIIIVRTESVIAIAESKEPTIHPKRELYTL
jgi:hypothetical protein